jgi:hypothetical protein
MLRGFLILLLCAYAAANSDDPNDIQLESRDTCSFYCFMFPGKHEKVESSYQALENFNCTHLVYGKNEFFCFIQQL